MIMAEETPLPEYFEPVLNKVSMTIGPNILFSSTSFKAILPKWMVEKEAVRLPDDWPEPHAWVELDSGTVLPVYCDPQRITQFVEALGDPRRQAFR